MNIFIIFFKLFVKELELHKNTNINIFCIVKIKKSNYQFDKI